MTTKPVKSSKAWHLALWMLQILLAGMFLMVGYMKAMLPIAELGQTIPMALEMPIVTRLIGIAELAAGLGLLLPAALRIRPELTVLAAAALVLVMILAMVFHVVRGEYAAIGTNMVLGMVAGFVAWGRLRKAPLAGRSVKSSQAVKT